MATKVDVRSESAALSDDVVLTPYEPGRGLPLFIQPNTSKLYEDTEYAIAWLEDKRPALESLLLSAGAIVLRGFPICHSVEFARIIDGYPSHQGGYAAGATQRDVVAGKVMEATQAPGHVMINLHQEMSYLPNFPKRIAFYCRMPSVSAGETFICDMREATTRIDPVFFREVEKRGVRYVRNFRAPTREGAGHALLDRGHKTWCQAFYTEDRAKAEADCRAMGLEPKWIDDGSLSVIYSTPGIITHPRTGEQLWFNQIPTQAITRMTAPTIYDEYEEYYKDKQRPFQNTYGDGTEIPLAYLDGVNALLRELAVSFSWSHGDMMFLDNYTVGHGRNTFTGKRDIQVALLS